MQWSKSSRPASGAEHQFSHLWDMEGHVHQGLAPSHGFKVGLATLAIASLYEELLHLPFDWSADVDHCCGHVGLDWNAVEADIPCRFAGEDFVQTAIAGANRGHIFRCRPPFAAGTPPHSLLASPAGKIARPASANAGTASPSPGGLAPRPNPRKSDLPGNGCSAPFNAPTTSAAASPCSISLCTPVHSTTA